MFLDVNELSQVADLSFCKHTLIIATRPNYSFKNNFSVVLSNIQTNILYYFYLFTDMQYIDTIPECGRVNILNNWFVQHLAWL